MLYKVDPTSTDPIFEQLAHQIRVALLDGTLRSGDKLPSARDMAAALDVNLHTILHAYQLLRDEGLLELRRGRGAIITSTSHAIPQPVHDALTLFIKEAHKAGLSNDTVFTLVKESLK
ncbi:GntR family transcriptional regulator [Timonella sp. A28]|uniref:GntR family transcriptional regulator n=1 Tax=Timonella sp. A28 TaxID=3442640 RepID=UPI003EBD5B69